MIEQSQKILLEAIKASLFDGKVSFPSNTDWNALIFEAKAQTVFGLISHVIPFKDEASEVGKAHYMRVIHEQDEILNLLADYSIECIVLKGCAAAVYYPKPYLRTMGDIDLLVPRVKYHSAVSIIERNGYKRVNENNRHVEFEKNGIEFEIHHHFSQSGFDIDDILENAIKRREYKALNGHRFPVVPDIENGLVLLGHINQHLKNNVLGLRQIIDWELYIHAMAGDAAWEKEFVKIINEIGLLKLAAYVTRLCNKYLGLLEEVEWGINVDDSLVDELLNVILTDGNFGRRAVLKSTDDERNIQSASYGIKKKGVYVYFRDVGLSTLKTCEKNSVLEPIAFLYGLVKQFCKGIKASLKNVGVSRKMKEGKLRYKLHKELGVRSGENK